MNTLILTGHSVGTKFEELALLTNDNKTRYAEHRGYDYERVPMQDYQLDSTRMFEMTMDRLQKYECVLCVGSDVIFTNWNIGTEDFKHAPLTIARENIRWWPINFDVQIWRRTTQALDLLCRMIDDQPIWKNYPWTGQNHIWNLIQTIPWIKGSVNIVEARRMNSTLNAGLSQWQLGDYILHLVDMDVQEKINQAKNVLENFPLDGTYIPTKKFNHQNGETI